MTNRNEAFGRLLKAGISSIANCEGKTAPIIEEELGQQVGLAGHSIQRYKAGHLPPEERTIEILAEAAVRRGYLHREWLQRFLHAARYPFADTLLDQLCPIGPARPRPPRVYENLPAPTYSQFIMRAQAFAEVIDGLQQRSAVVLIVGLGGNGKTSLAREVAARCLWDDGAAPRFDAIVWVSDKDRPGTTNLSIVLDEIARTLDYPGFTQFAHDEKLYEVSQLLKRQRVLVVVDNFEAITDGALLTWLLRLPEPSKTIVTTREYSRAFRNNTYVIDLRGMTEPEAQEFIENRLRFLKIERLVSDRTPLAPLIAATGGNPKAIEIALGCIKYERRPLQQVVDDLYAARSELFDDLFARAWALLEEAARRVLLATTFFPDSASAEALAATADVHGFAFDRACEHLTDLALLDEQRTDLATAPRYLLHPLVRSFAGARLAEQLGFEVGARERWITWYIQLVSKVGWCWEDLGRLEILDPEQETVYVLAKWTFQNQRYADSLQITKGIGFYCYVRGLWDKKPVVEKMCAESARHLARIIEEVEALAFHIQVLSKQGNIAEAETHLPRLYRLAQSMQLPGDVYFLVQHAIALYWMANHDLERAQQTWQQSLDHAAQFSAHIFVINRQWLATCLHRKGELGAAQQLLHEALHDAVNFHVPSSLLFCTIKRAAIALDQGDLGSAANALATSRPLAEQYKDREHLAEIHRNYARLHILRGDLPAARTALTEAIDLFERLGMRRELAEARAALADLDARECVAPAG